MPTWERAWGCPCAVRPSRGTAAPCTCRANQAEGRSFALSCRSKDNSKPALNAQARANLADHARLHKVVFDKGFLDGTDLWWLDQHGITFVVPAKTNMVVTADARAQAATGEGSTVGRRVHTVRHGQGKVAWTERLETEVVGITGLTTYDQYGTPEHGRYANRRDFQANHINAVVVRKWQGKEYGLGGKTVFLTNASVAKPLLPFDDYDDRSLIENCCIKEAKQQWDLGHPPQKTDRGVRVHVVLTLLMFALATAYRLQCEREATGGEPVGWQRWRRQLLEQTRDKVIVFAQTRLWPTRLPIGGHGSRVRRSPGEIARTLAVRQSS
jgi:hypothetical protein